MHTDTHRFAAALDLVQFIERSPTSFHAVETTRARLDQAGFAPHDEAEPFGHTPGALGFVVRGGGSIIAWRCGRKAPAQGGFRVVGAHTDSPNLRLKPRLARAREGYACLDVDVYGGVLLATWTDRDLGIAGRVLCDVGDGRVEARLIRLERPVARIPNLAIHLNREVNDKGLILNKHQHLGPVFDLGGTVESVRAHVLEAVAAAAGVDPRRVVGHDLALFDLQPPRLAGTDDTFVFAPRLDNLAMCHAGLRALLAAPPSDATAVVALFDHEEVGSLSARGADGTFLESVLARLAGPEHDALPRALARSWMVSADMAHAVHPHFADLHDREHMPVLDQGPVIKTNFNQRYASDGDSSAAFRRACIEAGVPCQEFVNRPDLACGTTIGPISAARLGLRTVDVGNPMLSMHSIREMAASGDVQRMVDAMTVVLGGGVQ